MSDVFISYAEEDGPVVRLIGAGLEAAGYTTWYYERDGILGMSYLLQASRAIDEARAVMLLISPASLESWQVDREVDHAHELGKPFLPLLVDISHREFRARQPKWSMALGTVVALQVLPDRADSSLPAILRGLAAMGIAPSGNGRPAPQLESTVAEARTDQTPALATGGDPVSGTEPSAPAAPEFSTPDEPAAEVVPYQAETPGVTTPQPQTPNSAATEDQPTEGAAVETDDPTGRADASIQAGQERPLPASPRALGRVYVITGAVAALAVGILLALQAGGLRPPWNNPPPPRATAIPSPAGPVVTGRLVDAQTGRGASGVTIMILKPGATYDLWFNTPGFSNEHVAAVVETGSDGAYRVESGLERARTYLMFPYSASYLRREYALELPRDASSPFQVPDLALTPYNPPTATPSAPPRPTPAPPTPTSIYDALDFSALLGLVTVTGRIVDEQTGQGLAGATFLVLKPGATYDDWFQQPGVYNDVVVASASTASDGRYQASPALDHGLTYQVVILTPTCYPNLQKTLVVSSETVGTAQLPDIAARRSDGC